MEQMPICLWVKYKEIEFLDKEKREIDLGSVNKYNKAMFGYHHEIPFYPERAHWYHRITRPQKKTSTRSSIWLFQSPGGCSTLKIQINQTKTIFHLFSNRIKEATNRNHINLIHQHDFYLRYLTNQNQIKLATTKSTEYSITGITPLILPNFARHSLNTANLN